MKNFTRRDALQRVGGIFGMLALAPGTKAYALRRDEGNAPSGPGALRSAMQPAGPTTAGAAYSDNPFAEAERIRLAAGVPPWIETGVPAGTPVGVDPAIVLETSPRLTAGQFAGSGPFLIENKVIENAGESGRGALEFVWVDVPITLTIRNCRLGGFSGAQVYLGLHPDSRVIIERCEIFATPASAGTYLVQLAQGNLTMRHCALWGSSRSAVRMERNGRLEIEECRFGSLDQEPAPGGMIAVESARHASLTTPGGSVVVRSCDIVPGHVKHFLYAGWPRRYEVDKCNVDGTLGTAFLNPRSVPANDLGFTLRLSHVRNCGGGGVDLFSTRNAEVAYCTFENGRGRLCNFESIPEKPDAYIANVEIHHCRGTQTLGEGSFGGYECFMLYSFAKDSSIHDCYVTECTDDAFEVTNPRSNVHVYNCVADNVTHDVVDYWNDGPYREYLLKNQYGNSVHHIYGTTLARGVLIGGQIGLEVSHVYVRQDPADRGNAYGVLLQRTSMGDGYPDYCRIIPPLPPATATFVPVHQDSAIGTHNVVLVPPSAEGPGSSSGTSSQEVIVQGPHPNPFGARAELSVTVPDAQRIRLDVFNAQGQQMLPEQEVEVTARVSHALRVDAGGLPSGLYVFRVTGKNFAVTRTGIRIS